MTSLADWGDVVVAPFGPIDFVKQYGASIFGARDVQLGAVADGIAVVVDVVDLQTIAAVHCQAYGQVTGDGIFGQLDVAGSQTGDVRQIGLLDIHPVNTVYRSRHGAVVLCLGGPVEDEGLVTTVPAHDFVAGGVVLFQARERQTCVAGDFVAVGTCAGIASVIGQRGNWIAALALDCEGCAVEWGGVTRLINDGDHWRVVAWLQAVPRVWRVTDLNKPGVVVLRVGVVGLAVDDHFDTGIGLRNATDLWACG